MATAFATIHELGLCLGVILSNAKILLFIDASGVSKRMSNLSRSDERFDKVTKEVLGQITLP